jgi:hypothetical protein
MSWLHPSSSLVPVSGQGGDGKSAAIRGDCVRLRTVAAGSTAAVAAQLKRSA